jgi:phosphohistidine phosphatase
MSATLIFIRHAKPIDHHPGPDSTRPLSAEGTAIQKRLADLLEKEGFTPDRIFCSPLLRAIQSAKILANKWDLPITETSALGINFDSNAVLKLAKEAPSSKETLFFVGHEPTLAQLANSLVGQSVLPYGLSKSGAIIMQFDKKIEEGSAKQFLILNPS